MSAYFILLILSVVMQSLCYYFGKALRGKFSRPLDAIVIALGLFQLPPLILAVNPWPVGLWTLAWVGSYFIGNLPLVNMKRLVVFIIWLVITTVGMIQLGPG